MTDMAVDSLDHSDITNLPTSWKTVCYATKTRRQIQAQQVQKPTVKTTKPITLPPFSTTVVHGHTKLKGHGLKLNLIAEPFKNSQLPSNIQCTSNLLYPRTWFKLSYSGSKKYFCKKNYSPI